MHCHSTATTPPQELYALAKRRGMDFVTITDRDTIDGVMQIADRPDVFLSVELTAFRRDSLRLVRVLCHGISAFDHEWLQRRSHDLDVCLAYLREHSIAHSLADAVPAGLPGYVYTETPQADTPWDFLAHVRRGWATTHSATELAAAA
jgi:hypothetical protein